MTTANPSTHSIPHGFALGDLPGNGWPPLPNARQYEALVIQSLEKYLAGGYEPVSHCVPYQAAGSYLRFDLMDFNPLENSLRYDADGIPEVYYPKSKGPKDSSPWYNNPVTTAEFALHLWSREIEAGDDHHAHIGRLVNHLISTQRDDGAFAYDFAWRYYLIGDFFPIGWLSGMSQGEALSILGRWVAKTGDEQALEAGKQALACLLRPTTEAGGTSTLADFHPALSHYRFYEEYVCHPHSYTLNGGISALLGLWDWAKLTNCQQAYEAFMDGCNSLKLLLPYYELGGFSAYDLGYLTHPTLPNGEPRKPHIGVRYHMVHVYLLHALHTIVPQFGFGNTATAWAAYPKLFANQAALTKPQALKKLFELKKASKK